MNPPPIRVLLLEDNMDYAQLLHIHLTEMHEAAFEVTHVVRLSEALAQLSHASFDVILSDLGLPDSIGAETVARLHSAAAHIPIVVLTGHSDDETVRETEKAGAQAFLVKGQFNSQHLCDTIAQYARVQFTTPQSARRNAVPTPTSISPTLSDEVAPTPERIERRLKQVSALSQMGQKVLSNLALETVLQQVVSELLPLLNASGVSILLLEKDELIFRAIVGVGANEVLGQRMPANAGIAGEVLSTGLSALLSQPQDIARFYAPIAQKSSLYPQSLMAAPIQLEGQTIGVMEAVHVNAAAFERDDLRTLETATTYAATAIGNARQHEEVRRRWHVSETLAAIGQALNETLELERIFQLIVDAAHRLIPKVEQAVIHLLEESSQALRAVAIAGGDTHGESAPLSIRIGQGIAGQVIATGTVMNVPDIRNDPRYLQLVSPSAWRSLMVAPIRGRAHHPFGTISVQSAEPAAFGPDDEQLLEQLGVQAAIAIQNARLLQDLQHALKQEQAMRAQLVQADKLAIMGRMIATVAHEFNNPLQAVQNCLYLLVQDLAPSDPQREILQMALSETQRMGGLVAQLRAVYQPGSAEQLRPLALTDIVQEVHTLVTPHLQKNRVQWQYRPPEKRVSVKGIANQLKQIFINLCLNAVEAMQPKGGSLTIRLITSEDNKQVGVQFQDTGPGIAPENLPHLFEPFFTTKGSGMGLGLAICYDIAQQHGGRIVVDSPPGRGATFTVWLPLTH